MQALKIVIIEDEEAHFELMKRSIRKELPSASIEHFSDAAACLAVIGRLDPDLIVVDYLMPGMNGIEFLEELSRHERDVPIIMITGQGDESIAVMALKLGASDYVVKTPNFFSLLPGTIEKVIHQKRLKYSLQELERRFQDLADSAQDWIWEIDAEGRFTYSNPAVERALGYRPDEVIGSRFESFFLPDARSAEREAAFNVIKEGRPISGFTTCVTHRDGREVFLETSGVPVFDPLGKLAGYRGIDRDVTRRQRAEQALRKANDELEIRVEERTRELAMTNRKLQEEIEERKRAQEALQLSTEELKLFAYSILHDLKSPTVAACGLTRLLARQYADVLDEKGRKYCDQIMRASEHIAEFVDKINVFIASKESRLTLEEVHFSEIVQAMREEFSERLCARGIRWIEPERDLTFKADRLCMIRVMRNFIDNALKYGGEELREIRISWEDFKDYHILSVSDDGKGMKLEDCEKIFEPFKRNGSSTGIPGTGLGLAIVKKIADRHGGTVWVEPAREKGVAFRMSISKSL